MMRASIALIDDAGQLQVIDGRRRAKNFFAAGAEEVPVCVIHAMNVGAYTVGDKFEKLRELEMFARFSGLGDLWNFKNKRIVAGDFSAYIKPGKGRRKACDFERKLENIVTLLTIILSKKSARKGPCSYPDPEDPDFYNNLRYVEDERSLSANPPFKLGHANNKRGEHSREFEAASKLAYGDPKYFHKIFDRMDYDILVRLYVILCRSYNSRAAQISLAAKHNNNGTTYNELIETYRELKNNDITLDDCLFIGGVMPINISMCSLETSDTRLMKL